MAMASSLLSSFAAAALESEAPFSFFLGQVLAKCPRSPKLKHQTLDGSLFFFPCCLRSFDARAASSSSSFFTLTVPLLLFYLLMILLISSWQRIAHMSAQDGNAALPSILWTNVSHSSETAFRAVLTKSPSFGVAPMLTSWSRMV